MKPVTAYIFGNNMVMAFDAYGKQVPDYQGPYEEVAPKLAAIGIKPLPRNWRDGPVTDDAVINSLECRPPEQREEERELAKRSWTAPEKVATDKIVSAAREIYRLVHHARRYYTEPGQKTNVNPRITLGSALEIIRVFSDHEVSLDPWTGDDLPECRTPPENG